MLQLLKISQKIRRHGIRAKIPASAAEIALSLQPFVDAFTGRLKALANKTERSRNPQPKRPAGS